MDRVLRVAAPAKLNLALRVLGRRRDGYHELETVFCAIDLCDQLYAARAAVPGIALELVDEVGRGLAVAVGADNLVVRAARAVLDAAGCDLGLRFRLEKRIPAGGGLGGGSSDAAAALRLTNALLDAPLSFTELDRLALGLGADVPFFLRGGTCWAGGVGERLWPIELPHEFEFVVVLPEFGTSTARVFELLGARLIEDAALVSLRRFEPPSATEIALALTQGNDLEDAALRATSGLRALRDRMHDLVPSTTGIVRMSGSGSTFFVACDDASAADRALAALRSRLDQLLLPPGSGPARAAEPGGAGGAEPALTGSAGVLSAGGRPAAVRPTVVRRASSFGVVRAPEPATWPGSAAATRG